MWVTMTVVFRPSDTREIINGRAHVGYEIVNSQLGVWHQVGYNHLSESGIIAAVIKMSQDIRN